jgi:D-methionine transport system ATP-binding protein
MEHLNPGIPELALEQVSVISGLGHVYLLNQVSFRIEQPGLKIGIVGASGAGKTTLLRLLNRLIDPNEGKILWQGKPLGDYPPSILRQRVMLVPQEPQLLGMTVEQALIYPLQLQKLPPADISQRMAQWEQRLNIPQDWKLRQPMELSGGQRQWVSLGRALMAQPQILLLDEPISALDSGRIELLCRVLRQLPCTVLIASHQYSVLQTLCDRILWIEQGQLKQDTAIQETNWSEIQAVLSQKMAAQPGWDDFNEPHNSP